MPSEWASAEIDVNYVKRCLLVATETGEFPNFQFIFNKSTGFLHKLDLTAALRRMAKYCIEKIICSGFACPECDYDTKEENLLKNHVTENHPLTSTIP